MIIKSHSGEFVIADPLLDPANIHEETSGELVGNGPHGESFVLTEEEKEIYRKIVAHEAQTPHDQLEAWLYIERGETQAHE